MPAIILPDRWRRQPSGLVVPDWSSPGLLGCQGVFDGQVLHQPYRARPPAYSSVTGRYATPHGVGPAFTGGSNSVLRFDGLPATAGSDEYTLELLCYASSYPSLAHIAGVGPIALADGVVNEASENGKRRSIISYSGSSDPYNIYVWGYSADADTGDAFQANKLQHVVFTKASGSSASISVYRNGQGIYSGSVSGTWDTSGTYLYIGGRHSAGAGSIVGTVLLANLFKRALTEAEVRDHWDNPWQVFKAPRRVLYFATAGGAVTINATPGDATAAGVAAQVLVGTLIQATPGNVTAEGAAAQVLVGVLIQATAADATAEGVTATVQVGSHAIIAASPALGEALGVTAQILVGTLVNAVPADAVAAGVAAQVLAAVLVQATPGEAIAEGVDALVSIPGETTLTAADLAAIWDDIEIEPGISPRMALRILLAAVGGKRVGLGTATEQYMAQDGTTPRITFSPTDAAGNGTPIVDGS